MLHIMAFPVDNVDVFPGELLLVQSLAVKMLHGGVLCNTLGTVKKIVLDHEKEDTAQKLENESCECLHIEIPRPPVQDINDNKRHDRKCDQGEIVYRSPLGCDRTDQNEIGECPSRYNDHGITDTFYKASIRDYRKNNGHNTGKHVNRMLDNMSGNTVKQDQVKRSVKAEITDKKGHHKQEQKGIGKPANVKNWQLEEYLSCNAFENNWEQHKRNIAQGTQFEMCAVFCSVEQQKFSNGDLCCKADDKGADKFKQIQ